MDHSRGAGGIGLVRPGGGALGPGLDDDRAVADDTWTVVARERLMREAERFSHVGSFSYCSASGALEWSDELFRIFGLDPATAGPLDASSFEAAIHPDDVNRVRAALAQARDGQLPPLGFRVWRPDGAHRFVQLRGAQVLGGASAPVRWVGTVQDVTEQRHLEEALLQARKLEALGRLAGGVAHDFNNLLAVMLLVADELSDCIRHPALDELRTAIERGAALTRQMLTFGRKAVLEPQPIEVAGYLRQCMAMGARLIGDAARIEIGDVGGAGAAFVDPAQLQHALLNLLINARDAMPRGGTIRVSAARSKISSSPPDIRPALEPGQYVEIVVRDEGEGIDAWTLAHMFEPFFTTKPGGSGLGLATVFGTISQSGGGVRVQSSVARGTSFHVFVPAAQAGPVDPPRGVTSQPTPGRGRRVLVLDDRAELQQLMARVLRTAGYEPICVREIEALLREPRRWAGAIEALVTDVSMGGPHGPDIALRLWEFAPRLPVLFVSGHLRPELPATGVAPVALLNKPINSVELVARLGALLDGAN